MKGWGGYMKMVTAVIRTSSLERIVEMLEARGFKGMTIFAVKGTGEEVRLNNPYTIHERIEIVVPDDQADSVVDIILEHGRSGLVGDGIVAVAPLEYAVKIRTKERLT